MPLSISLLLVGAGAFYGIVAPHKLPPLARNAGVFVGRSFTFFQQLRGGFYKVVGAVESEETVKELQKNLKDISQIRSQLRGNVPLSAIHYSFQPPSKAGGTSSSLLKEDLIDTVSPSVTTISAPSNVSSFKPQASGSTPKIGSELPTTAVSSASTFPSGLAGSQLLLGSIQASRTLPSFRLENKGRPQTPHPTVLRRNISRTVKTIRKTVKPSGYDGKTPSQIRKMAENAYRAGLSGRRRLLEE